MENNSYFVSGDVVLKSNHSKVVDTFSFVLEIPFQIKSDEDINRAFSEYVKSPKPSRMFKLKNISKL